MSTTKDDDGDIVLLEDENPEEEESCYIVEEEPNIIEIKDDSVILDRQNSDISISISELPSGYQIVDQTFESDNENDVTLEAEKEDDKDPKQQQKESEIIPSTPIKAATSNSADSQRNLIDIKFNNKKTYFAFHEEFIDLIKKHYKKKLDDLDINDDPANNRVCVLEKLVKKSDIFQVDTTPNANFNSSSVESTPRYTSLSKNALTDEKSIEDDENLQRSLMSSANKCFNCNKSNHSLRDCPEPRNMTKIRKARNEFNRKELRYHDEEDAFSHIIPGQLSDELKAALGIMDNEVPLHVYKMRLYGYPPAWLDEAKVHSSGLSLFVETDNIQSHHDDDHREFKYDIQKIYDFPGYNVLPKPPQFVDRHRLLNLPPMQKRDSKEEFVKSLGDHVVNGYKKRKLKDDITNGDITSNTAADMDIDDGDDDGIKLDFEPQPPGIQSPDKNSLASEEEDGEVSNSNGRESPSEEQLEIERNNLLLELRNDSKSSLQLFEETIIENSVNENLDNSSKDIQIGHVQTTVFGTTVLPAFSPFDNLPAGDKFQQGVSDVIAFENLAESTGKYEKMKVIIKKVRCFLDQHQKE